MNPYYSNWSYGYTLGASTEQSRGAYTVQKPPYSQSGGPGYSSANSGPAPGYSGAGSAAGHSAPKSAGSGAGYSQPAGPSSASAYSAGPTSAYSAGPTSAYSAGAASAYSAGAASAYSAGAASGYSAGAGSGYSATSGSGYLGGSSGSGYGGAKSGSWYPGANGGSGYRGANSGSGYSGPGVNSWSQVKGPGSAPLPKAQVFVTASGKSTTNTSYDKPAIGPNQPIKATVIPTLDMASVALTKLHDLAMQNKLVERYDQVEEKTVDTPEDTNIEFKVNLFLGTETYQGKGQTLKQAKQVAAVQALRVTKYQTANEKRFSMANTGRRIGVTATSELHELATKKGVRLDFKFLEPFNFEFKHSMRMWDKKEMLGNYRVQLNVAGYEFYGQAELPQQAKHSAATQAIPIVRNLPDPSGSATVVIAPPLPKTKPPGTDIKPPGTSVKAEADSSIKTHKPFHTDKNINMALNEIAMLNNCVPEWTLIGESGPPHQKQFSWQLRLGEFLTKGVGPNKKIARTTAAEQMMATLPEEWKQKDASKKRRGPPPAAKKRPNAVGEGDETPAKKKAVEGGKIVITADNPISCLFEYSKKVKIPDPEFECVAENLLETWQRASQTFKKVEYTIELRVDGKTYLATSHTKKAAKQACAVEAWNSIRATLL